MNKVMEHEIMLIGSTDVMGYSWGFIVYIKICTRIIRL